jgi:hypothetical protein
MNKRQCVKDKQKTAIGKAQTQTAKRRGISEKAQESECKGQVQRQSARAKEES